LRAVNWNGFANSRSFSRGRRFSAILKSWSHLVESDSARIALFFQYSVSRNPFGRGVAKAEPDGPGASAGGSGYGPNFGSIPDFDEPPRGVRFADVRDGTPAAKAGLKAGDILIEFDGKQIGNLYDFTYALRAHKPGDLVAVKVLRGGQTIEAKVLLTERR